MAYSRYTVDKDRSWVLPDGPTMIDIATRFTEEYKKYYGAHPAIREARCLSVFYPDALAPLEEGDIFAGTVGFRVWHSYPLVFSPQLASQIGYYLNTGVLRRIVKEYPECSEAADALMKYWLKESTFVKIREEAPPDIYEYYMPKVMSVTLDQDGYLRIEVSSIYISRILGNRLEIVLNSLLLVTET